MQVGLSEIRCNCKHLILLDRDLNFREEDCMCVPCGATASSRAGYTASLVVLKSFYFKGDLTIYCWRKGDVVVFVTTVMT